jgi:Flp pilus assembly protein TadG
MLLRLSSPVGPIGHGNHSLWARARRGIAAVELAVMLIVLSPLFVLTIDFARLFYYQVTIQNCARNGALYGASLRSYQESAGVSPYTDIYAVTLAEGSNLSPPLTNSNVTVTTGGKGSDGNANVKVAVAYTFNSITRFPGLGTQITLNASASMRVAP